MKIVLAPDSFKGSLSAARVCDAMGEGVREALPDAEAVFAPMSDGGEGLTDALLRATGGQRISATVRGPRGDIIQSFSGMLPDAVAVVETAAAAGLPLMNGRLDVERTTTYGVGELIARAVESGARRLLLGLGGSATNDGGCGMAAALGVSFFNGAGDEFIPVGGTLRDIARIDASRLLPRLKEIELVALSDVTNPLCGDNGAAAVYAPQKGADDECVRRLDDGLRHLASIIKRDLSIDVESMRGAGAAGGMGAGVAAFLGGRLTSGIAMVMDIIGFDGMLCGASLVITGEGRLDSQSAQGKVISGVLKAAAKAGVPAVALCGSVSGDLSELYGAGLLAAFSVQKAPRDLDEAMRRAYGDVKDAAYNVIRLRCGR